MFTIFIANAIGLSFVLAYCVLFKKIYSVKPEDLYWIAYLFLAFAIIGLIFFLCTSIAYIISDLSFKKEIKWLKAIITFSLPSVFFIYIFWNSVVQHILLYKPEVSHTQLTINYLNEIDGLIVYAFTLSTVYIKYLYSRTFYTPQ